MRKLKEQMKTLGTTRWLSSTTLLQFISGPGGVANDYNALELIHAPRGQIWKLDDFSIGRTAEHRTLLSLDASLAIPPRVLCFGPSRHPRLPPVRPGLPPVRPAHRSDRSGQPVRPVRCCHRPAEPPDLAFGSTKESPVVLW